MSFTKTDPENIQYQPIKLIKEYETRNDEDRTYTSLKKAIGIVPIAPDTRFIPGSILADFAFDPLQPTKCEFLIEVSMYNEGVKNFTDTLGGICDNLESFATAGIDISRICCIIIVDGCRPFYSTYAKQKNFFESFFIEDMIKERFGVSDVRNCKIPDEKDDDEFAHCFMQKVNFTDNPRNQLNFIFCVKQKNKRKLNTHLWFFGGFCEYMKPNYVMLIDVGTMPLPNSLFYLYEAMATQKDLAGCCGEIRPMDPNIWKLVVPAQVVEYKFSHVFDKALESVLGYITVLPGAFSAYRWEALQGDPLWKDYFKSICHPELMNAFNSNIYLAEDRVLCLSLISKKKSSYLIRYVKNSIAETDVPENISTLMSQRRRWVNGSWFSLIDSIRKCAKIYQSDHNFCRKIIFSLQMFYYVLTVLFTWVMVGSFYLAFKIVVNMSFVYNSNLKSFGDILVQIYLLLLIFVFVMSLGVKPNRVDSYFRLIAAIFGIYMVGTIICTCILVLTFKYPAWVIYIILGTAGSFGIGVVFHCATMTILKGVFHYLFLTPTYVNIFLIYSICNIHDCTWGNRPDLLTQEEKNRIEEFEEFRTRWIIIWVLCNGAYVLMLTSISNTSSGYMYIYALALLATGIVAIRFLGSILYLFQESWCKKRLIKSKNLKVVPAARRASASLSKLESLASSKRGSTFKPEKIPQIADKIEPIQAVTEFEEDKNQEVEFMRRKSRKSVNEGIKIDEMIVEDVQTSGDASAYIREQRFKKGITLKKLSEMTGLAIDKIKKLEEGKDTNQEDLKKVLDAIQKS
ncbi:hypothetical protein SteCoe_24170 [Stentor coeruleus]|uniref:chitin synthase n=1 Tax=Stentor coeruleus TaxID=5963 RepID=A0A1R2BI52_9CILI|nr:hypothetical protein SteCoe_24170 [Stentor coeruleus]